MKRFDLFVKLVEVILNVACEFRYDVQHDLDDGDLAGAILGTNIILVSEDLKKNMADNPLLFYLVLAHEIRHVWQFTNQAYSFENYYSGKESPEKYETQECEIDANAFAYLVLHLVTGKTPKHNTWKIYSYDSIMLRVRELEFAFRLRCKNRDVRKLVSILKSYN